MVFDGGLSIAIPYHGDRRQYTYATIRHLTQRPFVSEIVVSLEPESIFDAGISSKVRVVHNDTRRFVFRNKVRAVQECKSEWVALCDSDNVFNMLYFNPLLEHFPLNPQIIYCPEMGLSRLIYTAFVGNDVRKDTVWDLANIPRFDPFFNTMNYIFHRKTWLAALESAIADSYEPGSADSKWINYNCLNAGMAMRVVKGMLYRHIVDSTSHYRNNQMSDAIESPKIYDLMRQWKRDIPEQSEIKTPNWSAT